MHRTSQKTQSSLNPKPIPQLNLNSPSSSKLSTLAEVHIGDRRDVGADLGQRCAAMDRHRRGRPLVVLHL